MILMDVGADGQIQTADPPFFQIFLNADPTGGAVREFAVLSAAAVDQAVNTPSGLEGSGLSRRMASP